MRQRLSRFAPPAGVLAALIALWYLTTYAVLSADRRFLMPPPHVVVHKGFDSATLAELLPALGQTVLVSASGLILSILIGVCWAIAMSQADWIQRSLFPYAVILQCIPVLALVPLIGFWFGYDYPARVIACVMVALFPMVSNTLFGLQSVQPSHREMFRVQKASRSTTLLKLELPTALPAILAGMRISAGLSVVGAVVADFFFRRGQAGLGALISNYQSRVQTPQLFAAIALACLFGVTVFWLFGWLAQRLVGKWTPTQ
ncbi:ABC transporter permease [Mycolicibacterium mageritense]|uniref:ABC transporter permease n=1 Tax=Mycolicibacterium mageritense TaxID=53462 RepID=UPI001E42DB72|nr:ABC transporter permease [Mycolicibacterium mageritense]GJJ21432.1 nitrate ABC transporter permease [Mycolicibacterium mageritense]